MWWNGEAIRFDHIYLPKGGSQLGAMAPKEQSQLELGMHFKGLKMHQT